jgi:putative ABC transport system permease protein
VLVVAIALVIAMGTGLYTSLGSMETWRKRSNDESFSLLDAHDLKVVLAEGSYARAGSLRAALRSIPSAATIAAAEERLVAPSLLDASHDGRSVLTSGQVVGVDLRDGPPQVDGISAEEGRSLGRRDRRRAVAVVEAGFAGEHNLPATGRLRVAGGHELRYVGHGRSPEYFLVTRPGGGDFGGAESSFGVLFVPMPVAQRVAGRANSVNQLVLTVRPGADRDAVRRQLERVLPQRMPGLGASVEELADEPAHRVLYKDAEGDQRIFNIFALLILAGAAFAAFNLATRVVEAQRREIGVGMALGVSPRELAIRPLLLGAEIAILGAALGVVLGLAFRIPLRGALESLLPLPVVVTPFETGVFVRGAALGFAIPLLATAWPVWRGLRVTPLEAIRVGFRSAKGGGLAPVLERLPLPGGSLAQMPLRNVLRAPRRTFTTALGVAAVITVVVALLGMIDSFVETVDRSERQAAGATPERLNVELDRFRPIGSEVVAGIERARPVGSVEPRIAVPGGLRSAKADFDVTLRVLPAESRMWRPTVTEGRLSPGARGVLISEKAARDLGVAVGDGVVLRHPRRAGPASFSIRATRLQVVGLHADPFRTAVYMDSRSADLLRLEGQANELAVVPAAASTQDEVKRALFGRPGVVSVESVTAAAELMDKRMDDFVGVLQVIEAFALLLALLIAFNSTSISADERAREHATMFAYGVPIRTAVRLAVSESLLVGVAATVLGLALGLAVVGWVVGAVTPDTFPDLGVEVYLAPGSMALASLLGVVAVGLAPLFTARRLRRMDIPATLRIVE